jgi:hypothetical protein
MNKTSIRAHFVALAGLILVMILGVIGIHKTIVGSTVFEGTDRIASDELIASARVCQTFVAQYPALYKIRVFMATYARSNTGQLLFELRSTPDDPDVLVSQVVDLAQIDDNTYYTFEFLPLSNSEGRPLAFCLQVPDGQEKNSVGVWGAGEDVCENGNAIFDGMRARGIKDLIFTIDYRFSYPHTVAAMVRRVAHLKPAVWGKTQFYFGLGVVYLSLLYGLLYKLVSKSGE